RRYFEHFRLIWEDSRSLAVNSPVSAEDAWDRFRERVNTTAPVVPMAKRNSYGWLRIAAVFFVVAAASWVYYRYSRPPGEALTLQTGIATRTDTLTDGTIVTLNRNSRLVAQRYFNGPTRTVELDGEAFFDVASDKSKP